MPFWDGLLIDDSSQGGPGLPPLEARHGLEVTGGEVELERCQMQCRPLGVHLGEQAVGRFGLQLAPWLWVIRREHRQVAS